ncbi:group II intron maturase-specific domain-containing protein [Salibacterium sp. K-3]
MRVHKKSFKRAKECIRVITSRKWSISMDDRIKKLNQFLIGWRNYFALAETPMPFRRMMEWMRRRLHECQMEGSPYENKCSYGVTSICFSFSFFLRNL